MLRIRLSRIGKNQYATFRIVVAEHARAVKGKALEILGSYDPHHDGIRIRVDRVKHWLAKGAQASPTVHNLLVDEKIITGKKVTAWKPPKKVQEATSPSTPSATESAGAAPADSGASPAGS